MKQGLDAQQQLDRAAMDVVAELLELGDEQRATRLSELSDEALRERVAALLRQITRDVENSLDGSFVESTRRELADDAIPIPSAGSLAPSRVGAYQILRHLGAGGMGDVYEAEQDRPRRRVALKLLRSARLTPAAMRRFEYEAEWLGRLDHEGIARIYEAGTAQTHAGLQPFFALELIDGQRLDAWLRSAKPSLDARLRLLIELCDAVHHAHQRGIIHRDLKPANILVTASSHPKILDFGVARALGDEKLAAGDAMTLATSDGSLVGTLQYMSPEQVAGRVRDIDTRCDVYALGVIAYELLSNGKRPYELSDKPIDQCLRIVQQQDPPPLGSIDRQLRGDLEQIVAKALSKEKERRYASAAELADDLRRYLEHKPVVARPPTLAYQTVKFARRNRTLVATSLLLLVVLLVGLVGTSIGFVHAVRARRAEADASRQAIASAKVTEQVNQFLKDLLLSVDPQNAKGKDLRVRDLLDRAAADIDKRFGDQVEVAANLHNFVGSSYDGLGLYEQALHHQIRARDLRTELMGADDIDALTFASNVAVELDQLGRTDEAVVAMRPVITGLQRVAGPNASKTLSAKSKLAFMIYQKGRYAEAVPLLQELWEQQERIEGSGAQQTILTANNLALALNKLGRPREAEAVYRSLLGVMREDSERGPDHPDTLRTMNNLARCLQDQGNLADAETILRELAERCTRVFGPDHNATLTIQNNLAGVLCDTDRWAEADPIYRDILKRFTDTLGPDHPSTLQVSENFAIALDSLKKHDEAVVLARKTVDGATSKLGPDHPLTFETRQNLATILLHDGRPDEALPILQDVIPRIAKVLGDGHTKTVMARQSYAEVLLELGRRDEAMSVMAVVMQACDAPDSQVRPAIADKYRKRYHELTQSPATTQSDSR
jgi:serine/threonine protein kinase